MRSLLGVKCTDNKKTAFVLGKVYSPPETFTATLKVRFAFKKNSFFFLGKPIYSKLALYSRIHNVP